MALSTSDYLKSMVRRILGAMIQVVFGFGSRVVGLVGAPATGAMMRALGWIHAATHIPYLRPRIARNMKALFPTTFQHRWVAKNLATLYQSAGFLLCLPRINENAVARELGTLRRRDVLERLQRDGRGCLMVGLHFGNHRFLAPGLAAMGFPVSALIATFPQGPTQFGKGAQRAAANFRTSYAKNAPAQYLSTRTDGATIQAMIDTAKEGRFLLLLADGCIGRQRTPISFLGQLFRFPSAAPVIAARAGVPLVPVLSIRETREVIVGDPIEVTDEAGSSQALASVLSALEPIVAERPWEWWTWFHLEREQNQEPEPTWRLLTGAEAFTPF